MGRAPCCDKANVKKGPWSPEEDAKLKEYIEKYGTGGNWIALPQKVGLKRCGKSCRLRWLNYLRPNIKHGEFSDEEDRIICTLFANIGSRWSIIAAQLPGRTDNDIKNYWNTKLKKKLMGFVHNSASYNNPHRKFMINAPTLINQNPSDHHESTTIASTTTSSFSLSHLLMPSSFYKDHHSNSYDYHNYHSTSMSIPSNSTTRSFSSSLDHQMPNNNYSNPTMTTSASTFNSTHHSTSLLNFQAQDHHNMVDGFLGQNSGQHYCPHVKDNNSNNLVMFGSNTNEGSCSTSSDGSCNYHIKQEEMGFQYPQGSFLGMLSNNNNNNNNNYNGNIIGDDQDHYNNLNLMWGHKASGCFGETPLADHDHQQHFSSSCVVEDAKQMISTSSYASNNFSFFINVDENKTQENKVLYF